MTSGHFKKRVCWTVKGLSLPKGFLVATLNESLTFKIVYIELRLGLGARVEHLEGLLSKTSEYQALKVQDLTFIDRIDHHVCPEPTQPLRMLESPQAPPPTVYILATAECVLIQSSPYMACTCLDCACMRCCVILSPYLEESLAAFACANTIVLAGGVVSTHGARALPRGGASRW